MQIKSPLAHQRDSRKAVSFFHSLSLPKTAAPLISNEWEIKGAFYAYSLHYKKFVIVYTHNRLSRR